MPITPVGDGAARLLLVDDYPDALELLALLLEQSGYAVDTARTGADALDLATRQPPHLAILDVQLPDMTGLDVARTLRGRAETANVPLIALTGRSSPQDARDAHEAGIDAVFVKPCEPSELLATIRTMLAR
jgi:two-component system, OmpR family, phosphate regulon response regulator PhoB